MRYIYDVVGGMMYITAYTYLKNLTFFVGRPFSVHVPLLHSAVLCNMEKDCIQLMSSKESETRLGLSNEAC